MIIILHKYLYRRHTKEKGLSIHCAGAHTKDFASFRTLCVLLLKQRYVRFYVPPHCSRQGCW